MDKTIKQISIMENENILFDRIKRVDAPPFLYTRIIAKIEQEKEKVPSTWLTLSVVSFCTVLLFNVFLAKEFAQSSKIDSITSINKSLNLTPSNQLYHD